jgi:hypothetical protein
MRSIRKGEESGGSCWGFKKRAGRGWDSFIASLYDIVCNPSELLSNAFSAVLVLRA